MTSRITQIMEREDLTSSRFAEAIGIPRSAMSHILNGRYKVSLDVLMKILERFPYVDTDWLLFGKGEMTQENRPEQPDLFQNTPINPSEGEGVPEFRKEIRVETPVNNSKQPVIEKIIHQETSVRNINKIMIFYSDNTFETFIPEKGKKE